MSTFPLRAKIYILGMILTGSLLLLANVRQWASMPFWMVLGIAVCAALSVIAMEKGATPHIHYSRDTIFAIFALLLFGVPAAMFVALFAYSVQWIWARIAWYRQGFNIASYFLDIQIAALIYGRLNPSAPLYSVQGVFAILAALACYTLINHLSVGIVVWLVQGVKLVESGALTLSPMLLDFTSTCLGVVAAILWGVSPFAVVLCLLALYPFFATLRIPALERRSETDSKTGLYNARYFDRALKAELKRSNASPRPLTVVMADLDLLREVNNVYGHLAGDQVLIGVAKILKRSVREGDIVARFGGEEFTLLLPDLTPEQARPRVEAMRRAVEAGNFPVEEGESVRVTMSFGVAGGGSLGPKAGPTPTATELIQRADAALYIAKQGGRNRVAIFEEA